MALDKDLKKGSALGDFLLDNGEGIDGDYYYWTFDQKFDMTLGNSTIYFKLDTPGLKDPKCDHFEQSGTLSEIVLHNAKEAGFITEKYDIVVSTMTTKQTFTDVKYDGDKETFTVMFKDAQDLCQLRMIEIIPQKFIKQ